jgi:hypothetical protein
MMWRYVGWRWSMSNLRRPSDKVVSDALRDINKKIVDLIRELDALKTRVTALE